LKNISSACNSSFLSISHEIPVESLVIDLNAKESSTAATSNNPVTSMPGSLSLDKGPLKSAVGAKQMSDASAQSVKIFSKFWGDETEDDPMSDSTLDPDNDSAADIPFASVKESLKADKYLDKQSAGDGPSKSIKTLRKSKSGKHSAGDSSSRVATRSTKGSKVVS
jgi:hypothetical protein